MNNSHIITLLFLALTAVSCSHTANEPPAELSIGIIADCQYHHREHKRERYYNLSATKLEQAVHALNEHSIDWSIHLGDFIDKDYQSYQTLLPIWQMLKAPGYHVLGNHDFSVAEELKLTIPDVLNMPARYYDVSKNNWRFVIIDGNDLSLYAYPKQSEKHLASKRAFQAYQEKSPADKELHSYNGAIG
ncbi:MAG: metallophosphoesterase, partial [Colwellia sp.]|nr:metallophosphoesterase [Colwellia sp.]